MARRTQSAVPLTVEGVEEARRAFVDGEPRNLFYWVATELIDLARKGTTKNVSVAQALAVLLQTWNAQFFRFRGGFHESDLLNIEALLKINAVALKNYRDRQIASFVPSQEKEVLALFASFEKSLGPVGAAKCLHLLAPNFFPLWDDKISTAYRIRRNPEGYISFMRVAKDQCESLKADGAPWPDLLKAIDEYNYWHFTLNPGRKKSLRKR